MPVLLYRVIAGPWTLEELWAGIAQEAAFSLSLSPSLHSSLQPSTKLEVFFFSKK